jgi:hypothetical protein
LVDYVPYDPGGEGRGSSHHDHEAHGDSVTLPKGPEILSEEAADERKGTAAKIPKEN